MQEVKDHTVNPDRWAESVFGEDFNQDQPDVSRAVPIHPDGWTAAVFAANIPVHPDLWSESVFIDGLDVAQMGTDYFSAFPVQHVDQSLA